jgi:hypothetical protein
MEPTQQHRVISELLSNVPLSLESLPLKVGSNYTFKHHDMKKCKAKATLTNR